MTSPPASVSPAGPEAPDGPETPDDPETSGGRRHLAARGVLHIRTGFARGGRRHLKGCYADLDGIESAVAVGERATTDDTRRKDRI